jgi:hypothetical protein
MRKGRPMFKRSIQLLLFACFVTSALWAADDTFVGDWKLNPSKIKLTDVMKVEKLGANKYAFDFEGDGNAETIAIDGTDQPGTGGTTLSVTAQGSDSWKVVCKGEGRMFLTANWKLSKDAQVYVFERQ